MRQKLSKYTGRTPWHKGRTGVYSEETRRRMGDASRGKPGHTLGQKRSEATKQKNRLARAKQVFPFRDSTSETIIQNKLSELGINFRKHKSFKIRKSFHSVDLFISPNVCIECDGEYFHTRVAHPDNYSPLHRDYIIDYELEKQGMNVIRLRKYDIDNNLNWCISQIKKAIKINNLT
jgi:very-short-patch-repair endonuclease